MDDQLRLLTVHAHPDDESSKGAGTIAKYHDEGAHSTLVCCTACNGAGSCPIGTCTQNVASVSLDSVLMGLGNAQTDACVP